MVVGLGGAEASGVPGVEVSGTDVEGEEAEVFFFFWGTVETKVSVRPASSVSAPVLLAPVSLLSGGETMSSSAR